MVMATSVLLGACNQDAKKAGGHKTRYRTLGNQDYRRTNDALRLFGLWAVSEG